MSSTSGLTRTSNLPQLLYDRISWRMGGRASRESANLVIRNERQTPLTDSEKDVIRKAFTDALCMAQEVKKEVDKVWDQSGRVRKRRSRRLKAWNEHELLTKWFGKISRHIELRRVRRRIHTMKDWLKKATIRVYVNDASDKQCDSPGRNALAPIRYLRMRPKKMHLCPPWFGRGDSRRPAIVVHELVHNMGFDHQSGAVDFDSALNLASSDGRKARKNPENFERLYEEYYCGP